MKKIILLLILFPAVCFGQVNYQWEELIEPVKNDTGLKPKSQIYSETKLFIAENWKSANEVIQSDDKETGIILIKGAYIWEAFWQYNTHTYIFNYNVKFLMKDGKCKIVIDNVENTFVNFNWPKLQMCDNCYPGYWKSSLKEERYNEIMASVKSNLQAIVDSYKVSISKTKSEW